MATFVTPYVGTSLVFARLTNLVSTVAVSLEALGCENSDGFEESTEMNGKASPIGARHHWCVQRLAKVLSRLREGFWCGPNSMRLRHKAQLCAGPFFAADRSDRFGVSHYQSSLKSVLRSFFR